MLPRDSRSSSNIVVTRCCPGAGNDYHEDLNYWLQASTAASLHVDVHVDLHVLMHDSSLD